MRDLLASICALLLIGSLANAQDVSANYPNRPIKIIVCVPAGGGVDTVTRIVAEGLQERLGQAVVVENIAGAAGNVGAERVFTARPDGYTLLASQPSPITVNPLLYKRMSFNPTKFEPVSILTSIPNVLLVRKGFPSKTAAEFLAYAKANPGKINYASQGIGTTSHLTAALLEQLAGIKLVHVPYKGTAPALNDLMGGHVDMIFMELASAMRFHKGGTARILAVATEKRIPALPDIPTFGELGIANFTSVTWNSIVAPPNTPPAIVAKLNETVNAVLNSRPVTARFAKLDLQKVGGSSAQAAAYIKEQTKIWSQVIRRAHVQAH